MAAEQGRAAESAAAAAAAAPTKDAKGVILFSNSRSGGGKGKQVLDALADIIGKDRVFDLGANPHPEQILAQPQIIEEARNGLRVIVCGGDGDFEAALDGADGDGAVEILVLPPTATAAALASAPPLVVSCTLDAAGAWLRCGQRSDGVDECSCEVKTRK